MRASARSPTTPAATATARSVTAPPRRGGLEAQAADLLDGASTSTSSSRSRGPSDPIALANPREVYGLLIRAAAETLIEVAADPKHLGAEIGVLAVLHTWGQNLELHPHVHCVVPGGGLSPDGRRWVACRPDFFLPVRVLSRVFRGKFLAGLRAAFESGRLRFPGELAPLAEPRRFDRLVSEAVGTEWVVYAKPPFGGPEVGVEVPGPVHAPGGDQQPPAGRSWRAVGCGSAGRTTPQAAGGGR